MKSTVTFALVLALGAGCSSMPRLVSNDALEQRDRRILELEREAGRAKDEAATLRLRVEELGRELDAARAANAASSAPVARETPPAPIEADAATATPRVAVEESDLAEPASAPAAPADETGAYEAALTLLRDGQIDAAERALEGFARAHADSALADNAWFWLGEARYARGDTAGAIDAYRTAIDRYPEGNKVPDTLLKLGVALAASGQTDAAREAWSELVRRFPTSAAAEAAAAKLQAP